LIPLCLFVFNLAPVSGSAGFVFTNNYPATELLGNIYIAEVVYSPWLYNQIWFGVAGNFGYKRSKPFDNEYLQDSGLSITCNSIGLGPQITCQFSDIFEIGLNMSVNYMMLSYPESGANSVVVTRSDNHWRFGTHFYSTFSPVSVGHLHFGIQTGIYINGTGGNTYYGSSTQPFENFGVYGLSLQIQIARS
jgi:hypothetical protein